MSWQSPHNDSTRLLLSEVIWMPSTTPFPTPLPACTLLPSNERPAYFQGPLSFNCYLLLWWVVFLYVKLECSTGILNSSSAEQWSLFACLAHVLDFPLTAEWKSKTLRWLFPHKAMLQWNATLPAWRIPWQHTTLLDKADTSSVCLCACACVRVCARCENSPA